MDKLRSVGKQYAGNLWSQSRKCCDAVQIFFLVICSICVAFWQSFMVVDAILERNPEVSFRSSIDMDRVSHCCP